MSKFLGFVVIVIVSNSNYLSLRQYNTLMRELYEFAAINTDVSWPADVFSLR